MVPTYTLLADLRAGRCSNAAEVYSIREAAANNLKRFAEEFGPEWAMQHLVPEVLDMITNPHYLHMMMASKDRVPNVKLNVAKLLQSLIPIVDHSVVEKTIRQRLVDLNEDPDVDVRYFANQALRSIDDAAVTQS
uniref:Condensin complex subunit 1 C-terminal domain-containing protein n=1 Tax=Brassica oleracea var. oleracea TaxID=109376 RepID=A0A0D3EDY0_BRAOL